MYCLKIVRPYARGTASRPGLPFHSVSFAGKSFTEGGQLEPATPAEFDHLCRVVASRVVRHSPDGRGEVLAASTFERGDDGDFIETPVASFNLRDGDEPLSRFLEVTDEGGRVVALD